MVVLKRFKRHARIWVQPDNRFWYYKTYQSMMEDIPEIIEKNAYKGHTFVFQIRNKIGVWKTVETPHL